MARNQKVQGFGDGEDPADGGAPPGVSPKRERKSPAELALKKVKAIRKAISNLAESKGLTKAQGTSACDLVQAVLDRARAKLTSEKKEDDLDSLD